MGYYAEVHGDHYYSLRFYTGTFTTKDVPYRIGDTTTTVSVKTERYYDTWTDFHLIPSERPIVALPKANSKIISIPGRSTPIDMTTYLTGHPTYTNRSGNWTFNTDVEYVEKNLGGWMAFDNRLRSLFHGHVSKIVLTDDPSYFYAGELTMSQWRPGNNFSSVIISYNLYPFKKSTHSSLDLWKWDEFRFEDDFIMYMKDMEVNNQRVVTIYGGKERISPHIYGSSGLTVAQKKGSSWVSYGSVPVESIAGPRSIIPNLVIGEGENQLRFNGNGYVTIDYRRGLL